MIGNLQLLRGLAALGVVFYHTDFRLVGGWHTEFFGVATFFVISGFIMCFITRNPDGGDATARGFMMRRIFRIVPLYWLCTFAFIAFLNRPPITRHIAPVLGWASVNTLHLLRSLFFVPSKMFPMLGVGWTLNFEIYFYVVFAVALMFSRKLAPLIAWVIVYAVICANDFGADRFLIKFYSHGYIHYFLQGIVLFYVWSLTKDRIPKLPTIFICSTIVIVSYGSQFITPMWYDIYDLRYCAQYIPVALVGSALFAASSGADIKWKPLTLIGDASYAVYLTHTIAIEFFAGFLATWKEQALGVIGIVIGALLIGIAVHLWIELPLGAFIRSFLKDDFGPKRPRQLSDQ